MEKKVSIIIPNWNGKKLLERNLPSVLTAAQNLGTLFEEIILVDDGSTDESILFARKAFPSITILPLEKNCGFHRATNAGFHASKGAIVILLNSDMEVTPHAFTPFIEHFNDPLLFGVSGRIYSGDKKTFLYGNRGGTFRWGHFSLYEKDEFNTAQSLFVCGGGGAFSREKFLVLGGFDTLYSPAYYEEQDISYRALKRGWHIAYEPQSIMYHQIHGTIEKQIKERKIKLISARNNYLFSIKNITDISYTCEMFVFIPLFLIRDLFLLRFRFWIAFFMALPRIPHAILKRIKEQRYIQKSDFEIFKSVQSMTQ